ncbi:MAG: HAMP domain-containing sensor histidine kinase [Leptospira sp.]|nr:HAMP domain-containing sensor histidine kinase [Leptospira sp.]
MGKNEFFKSIFRLLTQSYSDVQSEINKINISRVILVSVISIFVHIIHILFFKLMKVDDSLTKSLWQQGIILSHSIGVGLGCIFWIISYSIHRNKLYESKLTQSFQLLIYLTYMVFGIMICTIDQYVTNAISPFTMATVALSSIFLVPPLKVTIIYVIAYILFYLSLSLVQVDPAMLLSARSNGLTTIGIGLTVSWSLWFAIIGNIRKQRIIENQTNELEKKNEELYQLNQIKNDFIGMVSHDLKNPIGNVQNLSELILEEKNLDAHTVKLTRMIFDTSIQMNGLVKELLDVHSIETHFDSAPKHPCDLNLILTSVIDSLEQQVKLKNQQFKESIIGENFLCDGDQKLFRAIFENLISNAVKYSPQGMEIYIHLISFDSLIRLDVIDQGKGIPEEEQSKLFGQFSKLSTKPTAGESSHGLGLYIAKKLTLMLGGQISFLSRPQIGSRFRVEFPIQSR